MTSLRQWGYFETGIYAGTKEEKAGTLKKFQMGYYDIRSLITILTSLYGAHPVL